ncbi:MAG: 5'-nucleotidase C-terminal domain-containing protein [Candidatus Eisenbacteria bacterium]
MSDRSVGSPGQSDVRGTQIRSTQARGTRAGGTQARLRLVRRLLVLALPFVSACAHTPREALDREVTITLLQTTDFHGALESDARDRDGRRIGGADFLSAWIDKERSTNPNGTLVLDSGDVYQGTALSNLTDGRATIDYMNEVGFDASAVGNHEFDFGMDLLLARMDQAEFPFLCANVLEKKTGAPPSWAVPYKIFDRLGVRVAVIGLATPDTPQVTLLENVKHLDFLDPVATANRLIPELVPSKADIVVALCHMGGFQRNDGPIEGELVELAEGIEGEAAILGGHTHRIVSGSVDDTAIIQAGSNGRWVGRIDLVYDRETRRVTSSSTNITTVYADSLPGESVLPDGDVTALVHRYRDEIAPTLDEVIATAPNGIASNRIESQMGNWMTDLMREATRSDFAFQNPGGIRSSLDAGPVRFADVYRVMPFDNTIVVTEMTGDEVRAYLEAAARRGDTLHVSGLHYAVDFREPEGARVTKLVLADGSPLDGSRTYRLAVNNFMAGGGSDLPELNGRPTTVDTGMLVRDVLINGCRTATSAGRALEPVVEGRVVATMDGSGQAR